LKILADTHLHLYPCYDLARALWGLMRNLEKMAAGAAHAGFLVERSGCDVFGEMKRNPRCVRSPDLNVTPLGEVVLRLDGSAGGRLYLFSGRQVQTAERIEVLALATERSFPDGLPARQVVRAVREAGAVPVLPWAPGKWFGARGRLVRSILKASQPGALLLGDSSLRPVGWPEPLPMRAARRRGFGVLAGSDPLPFAEDERWIGAYASRFEGPFQPEQPLDSMRRLLRSPGLVVSRVGRRGGPIAVFRRLIAHRRARTQGAGGG
jgi:hypothetical protein